MKIYKLGKYSGHGSNASPQVAVPREPDEVPQYCNLEQG